MSGFNPRWLVGKTIARVEMNVSREGEDTAHQVTMHRPTVYFTDGSRLSFLVEEQPDGGEYGVRFLYSAPPKKGRSS